MLERYTKLSVEIVTKCSLYLCSSGHLIENMDNTTYYHIVGDNVVTCNLRRHGTASSTKSVTGSRKHEKSYARKFFLIGQILVYHHLAS